MGVTEFQKIVEKALDYFPEDDEKNNLECYTQTDLLNTYYTYIYNKGDSYI